jgi:predicted hotdog family 3-hydroxylacyl-ACP dehydratase
MSSPASETSDIQSLIPQRPPILMVDSYGYEDELNCHSSKAIPTGNMFLDETGRISAEGILEHIAQTAAAHIGYLRKQAGEKVNLGYIGDIKRCTVTGNMPKAGETLHTRMTVTSQVGSITLVSAETSASSGPILNCRMKLAND